MSEQSICPGCGEKFRSRDNMVLVLEPSSLWHPKCHATISRVRGILAMYQDKTEGLMPSALELRTFLLAALKHAEAPADHPAGDAPSLSR
jgi:hypothetical protein